MSFENPFLRQTNPYAKIGKATDVRKRLSGIQIGSPLQLKVFGYITSEEPRKTEKYIHSLLVKDRVSGEWFKISRKMISVIRSRFAIIDDSLDELFVESCDSFESIRIRELEARIIGLQEKIEKQKAIIKQNKSKDARSEDTSSKESNRCKDARMRRYRYFVTKNIGEDMIL